MHSFHKNMGRLCEKHERNMGESKNHEWTRKDTKGRGSHERHERHEKESRGESRNHEWTRMDTNSSIW